MIDAGVAVITATIHELGTRRAPRPSRSASTRATPRPAGPSLARRRHRLDRRRGLGIDDDELVDLEGERLHTRIFVVADPEQAIPDDNRVNNAASRYYLAAAASGRSRGLLYQHQLQPRHHSTGISGDCRRRGRQPDRQ